MLYHVPTVFFFSLKCADDQLNNGTSCLGHNHSMEHHTTCTAMTRSTLIDPPKGDWIASVSTAVIREFSTVSPRDGHGIDGWIPYGLCFHGGSLSIPVRGLQKHPY